MKDINLLPRQYITAEQNRKTRRLTLIVIGAVTLFLALASLVPLYMLGAREQELGVIQKALEDPKFDAFDRINGEMTELQQQLDERRQILGHIENNSLVGREILDVITGALPEEVYIKSISLQDTDKQISIQGVAKAREQVAQYVVQLGSIPIFQKIQMQSSSGSKEESTQEERLAVSYTITLQTKETTGEEVTNE